MTAEPRRTSLLSVEPPVEHRTGVDTVSYGLALGRLLLVRDATPHILLHGGQGAIVEVGLVLGAIFIAFGIVTLLERELTRTQRRKWIAIQLLLPIIGTVWFLSRRFPPKRGDVEV